MREQPVGWLEELSKLESMTGAASSLHLLTSKSWPVKFRLINKDTVLPSQTLLFMRDQTLRGRKLDTYVLLKILKYCTGSSVRSYQCKFAIDRVFGNKSLESMEEIGAAIKEVIHFNRIRGKFSSVHPDLAAEGITRVEVGEEGLHFITSTETGSVFKEQFAKHAGFAFIFSDDAKEGMVGRLSPPGNDDADILKSAFAMSLENVEQKEEQPSSIKGELLMNAKIAAEKDGL